MNLADLVCSFIISPFAIFKQINCARLSKLPLTSPFCSGVCRTWTRVWLCMWFPVTQPPESLFEIHLAWVDSEQLHVCQLWKKGTQQSSRECFISPSLTWWERGESAGGFFPLHLKHKVDCKNTQNLLGENATHVWWCKGKSALINND